MSFVAMGFFKNLYNKSRKSVKFSASDPSSFVEVWSFTSTRIRVISLVLLVFILFGAVVVLLFGGTSGGSGTNDRSIERDKLEKQREEIDRLTEQVMYQDKYIVAVQKILKGEVPVKSDIDSLANTVVIDYSKLNSQPSKSEAIISKEVKEDMRTTKDSGPVVPYFQNPVNGVVSQKFDLKTHPGVDVVTETNHTVKACLSGTVIYSGYTRKDGYVILIDHGNGYVSVYKHNKKALKKTGDKVKLGDPVAIVGNTGENTDGPHLHFELWYNQSPVDPENYLKFKN